MHQTNLIVSVAAVARCLVFSFPIQTLVFLLEFQAVGIYGTYPELILKPHLLDSPKTYYNHNKGGLDDSLKDRSIELDIYDVDIHPHAPVRDLPDRIFRRKSTKDDDWPKLSQEEGMIILQGVGQRLKTNQEKARQESDVARANTVRDGHDLGDAIGLLITGSPEESRFGYHCLKSSWARKKQNLEKESRAEQIVKQKGEDIERVGMVNKDMQKRMKKFFQPLKNLLETEDRKRAEELKFLRERGRGIRATRARFDLDGAEIIRKQAGGGAKVADVGPHDFENGEGMDQRTKIRQKRVRQERKNVRAVQMKGRRRRHDFR